MSKDQLCEKIASDCEISKSKANECLKSFTSNIGECLKKGESISLMGFGTFKISARKARMGINPRTREPLKIKASKAPVFKASKVLKAKCN